MKNRIICISLAVTLGLSVGLIGCGGEQIPEYALTISSTEGGSVTSPGEPGPYTYDKGEVVNLVAEAEEGYHFVNWTGNVGTIADVEDGTTTITMNGHYSVTANFARGPVIPPKNPGTFVQMTTTDVGSLDPAWGWGEYGGGQVHYIYETLVSWEGEKVDQFVPVLATEWELLDDNVTYRFKIREGVKFHEGGDLTPEDVEYSLERAMVQDRYAGPGYMFFWSLLDLRSSRVNDIGNIQVTFDQIDNAVEVDGDWVVFHLCEPSWALPFLQIICGPWASIVDKEWCIANGEWDGTEETWQDYNNPDEADSYLYDHANGTGPWKLKEWDPGVQIKLVRNDDYWREPAPFEMIITKVVEDWTIRKEALLAGDADFIHSSTPGFSQSYIELQDIEELEGTEDLKIYQDLLELRISGLFLNFDINSESEFIGSGALDGDGIPPDFFTDIDVRKGFSYAFDWETYLEDGLMGQAERRGSPLIEGLAFYNPDTPMYSHDLDKAEEHLKLAWGGEVWEQGFKFTMLYNSGSVARKTACIVLAENLLAINPKFQVSIQPMDWPTMVSAMLGTRDTPMFDIGWIPDYPHPNFVSLLMHRESGVVDIQSYGSPELDAKIEAAFEETDPVQQQAKYYELQEIYYQDPSAVMLWQPLGRRYFTKYIEGFYYNPFASFFAGLPLYYMSKSSS